jgi:hypothetical protein
VLEAEASKQQEHHSSLKKAVEEDGLTGILAQIELKLFDPVEAAERQAECDEYRKQMLQPLPLKDGVPDLTALLPPDACFEIATGLLSGRGAGGLKGSGGLKAGAANPKTAVQRKWPDVAKEAELQPYGRPGLRRFPPPENLPAFSDAKWAKPKTPVQGGGGLRKRWKDSAGNIFEWDSQHGTIEKYNRNGQHLGEFDPISGKQTKPPNPNYKVQK